MIKIIKDGEKEFVAKCTTCGCEFSYQLCDIGLGTVQCPCCGHYVAHVLEENSPYTLTTPDKIPISLTKQTTADWVAPDVTITVSTPKRTVTKTTNWLTANYSEESLKKIKELAMKECEEAGI